MGSLRKLTVISIAIFVGGMAALAGILLGVPEESHRGIAFGCFATCAAGFFISASVYFFTPRFLSYHQQAFDMEWEELPPHFRGMILATLRIVAGGFYCASVATIFLLWVPYRQEMAWAGPAIFLIYNVMAVPALYGTILVAMRTKAVPPLVPLVLAITLSIMGLVLSI